MAGRGIGTALKGVGRQLGAAEINRIAKDLGVPISDVYDKAVSQNINLSSKVEQNAAANKYVPTPVEPIQDTSSTTGGGGGGSNFGGVNAPGVDATGPTLDAAETVAEWTTRKAIAKLQEDSATERLKYEVDNRIPLTEAEYKGKIDLQKIVNAGNRRVANIQRGSQMFASMMGAFNF
jgi:hypothetical protein